MAKQGLRKIWILKDQIGLIWGEPDGRRREEEKRKRKKKEDSSQDQAKGMELWILGMETELKYGFMEF